MEILPDGNRALRCVTFFSFLRCINILGWQGVLSKWELLELLAWTHLKRYNLFQSISVHIFLWLPLSMKLSSVNEAKVFGIITRLRDNCAVPKGWPGPQSTTVANFCYDSVR